MDLIHYSRFFFHGYIKIKINSPILSPLLGWVPQGGALCILGIPNGAVLGCARRTAWWRERRGVGKADVPGEEDSEGNRPKGLTPV